jgi:hypothetical protein
MVIASIIVSSVIMENIEEKASHANICALVAFHNHLYGKNLKVVDEKVQANVIAETVAKAVSEALNSVKTVEKVEDIVERVVLSDTVEDNSSIGTPTKASELCHYSANHFYNRCNTNCTNHGCHRVHEGDDGFEELYDALVKSCCDYGDKCQYQGTTCLKKHDKCRCYYGLECALRNNRKHGEKFFHK